MKDEYDYIPPTYRSVKDSHDITAERLAQIKGSNGRIKVDDLLTFATSMTDHLSGENREITAELIGRALVNVTLLLDKHPESEELITGTATGLIFAGLRSVEDLILKSSQSELKKALPFLKANKQSMVNVERAKTIASELWQADTGQEYRVNDMAELVRDILKREGAANLPAKARMMEWIKPVAPHHARLGGRRRKTP